MAIIVDAFAASLHDVENAIAAMPTGVIKDLTDHDLLTDQKTLGQIRRALDSRAAEVAGEISYRSRRELGLSGLAHTQGVRTPAELITKLTGVSAKDAGSLVQVGTMMHDSVTTSTAETTEPWMAPAGLAVSAGVLSVEQAKAIRNGIGKPLTVTDEYGTVSGITSAVLTAEVQKLVKMAGDYSVDDLAVQARQARDDIDEAGIVTREQRARQERSLKEMKREGMPSRWLLTPDFETDAFMKSVRDSVMGPRSGGPRFVSEDDKAWARSVMDDPRTNDQYLHDAFFDLFRIGVRDSADPVRNRIVGPKQPGVRVLTSATTATSDRARTGTGTPAGNATHIGTGTGTGTGTRNEVETRTDASTGTGTASKTATGDGPGTNAGVESGSGRAAVAGTGTETGTGTTKRVATANPATETQRSAGHGYIEGTKTPISADTVERIVCADGVRPIYVDPGGHPMDVGRESRGYTESQRVALGAKWGGCANCGAPASYCEIHHIIEWANGGETNLIDGVPLCRFCHLMLHNNGWTITRDGDRYWIIPPVTVDPEQVPRKLIHNSPALRQYLTV